MRRMLECNKAKAPHHAHEEIVSAEPPICSGRIKTFDTVHRCRKPQAMWRCARDDRRASRRPVRANCASGRPDARYFLSGRSRIGSFRLAPCHAAATLFLGSALVPVDHCHIGMLPTRGISSWTPCCGTEVYYCGDIIHWGVRGLDSFPACSTQFCAPATAIGEA